jgi:hypothetical protein
MCLLSRQSIAYVVGWSRTRPSDECQHPACVEGSPTRPSASVRPRNAVERAIAFRYGQNNADEE